jgi:outer membrane cobalamin receptor
MPGGLSACLEKYHVSIGKSERTLISVSVRAACDVALSRETAGGRMKFINRKGVKMKKLIFLLIGLLLSMGARAEETSEATAGEKTYLLEPIIVTATRYPEHLRNIPAHCTLLSSSKLKNFNCLSLGEVLRKFSSGEMTSSGSLGQVQTFSLRGHSSSQVLFLLEGRKLNYLCNGIFNLSDLPLTNLDRVEIVRGPLSSVFGANALGGVVNLIPSPPLKKSFSASVLYGSENTSISTLSFASGIGNFRFDSGLERKQSEGHRENSDYSALFFHSTFFYRLNPSTDLKLYLSTQNDDLGLPGPVPDPSSVPKFGNSSVFSLYDHQKDENLSLDFTFRFRSPGQSSESGSGEREVLTRLFFDRREMDYATRYDFSGEVDETYSYLTKSLGGFTQCSFLLGERSRITLGLDFSADYLEARKESFYAASQTGSSLTWDPSSTTFGLWGNSSWNLGKFTFQLGTRYDLPSDFEETFSPNMGLIYRLRDAFSLKLSYGRAFRAPTFNDLYWPDGGNKDLKPEKGRSLEAGMFSAGRRVSSQIFLYHRKVRNLISWQPLGENGLWQPFNLDRFNSWGIELELDYRVSERLDCAANYSHNRAEEVKNELVYYDYSSGEKKFEELKRKARFLPENVFNLNLGLRILPSFSTQLAFNFRSERLNYYPDYSSYPEIRYVTKKIKSAANFDISFNQTVKNLAFLLKINNLFDERTPTQFGNSLSDLDYPNPGRKIFAGMRLEM